MLRNESLSYVCRDVRLRVEANSSPLTCGLEPGATLRMPVGHAEGNFRADDDVLEALEADEQVIFRYCDDGGEASDAANPNGSRNNIAGVRNARGNVAALMPHPDRAYEEALGGVDGCRLFESLHRFTES